MKKTLTFFVIAIALITQFAGCSKNNDPDAGSNKTAIAILVQDADSWSASNATFSNVSGATIKIYDSEEAVNNDRPAYTKTTDDAGQAIIEVAFKSKYYVKVSKATATNVFEGYQIAGVLKTPAEAAEISGQPVPYAGWPKAADLNGDGAITAADQSVATIVEPVENRTVAGSIYIAKPLAEQKATITAGTYPVTKASLQHPGQCFSSISAAFTCSEKLWDKTGNTLLFVDNNKVIRTVNGVVIIEGIGNGYTLSGKLTAGTNTAEGRALIFSDIVITKGVVTGKVSALIEPGTCSDVPGYLDSYVSTLKIALCYTTQNNVIQANAGVNYIEGTNEFSLIRI